MERRGLERSTHFLEMAKARTGQDRNKGKLARHTYILERAEVRSGQDTERKWSSYVHLLSGEVRNQDWSGHII